jgi:putative sugar O-methyltransferase
MKILEKEISESLFSKININIDFNVNMDLLKMEWESNRTRLRNKLEDLNLDFLNNSGIGGLMFQSDLGIFNMELSELSDKYYLNIKEYKQSNINTDIGVSTNTIHHLFHINRYLNFKNIDISNFKSKRIIEWGGGYGNMSKILIELGVTNNYLIIDLPEFISIQYRYLSSYFGEDKVKIIKSIDKIENDCINLISVNNIEQFPEYDLFISTWALTESSVKCQKICIDNGIFNRNMIIAYHQCGDHIPFMGESKKLHNLIMENMIHTEEIYFGGGKNYYAFI